MRRKKLIYGSDRVSSDSEGSERSLKEISRKEMQEGRTEVKKKGGWSKPLSTEVKMIDFGGATYANEHHT